MKPVTTAVPACPMCGSFRRRVFCEHPPLRYVRCRACRTIYADPRPSDESLLDRLNAFASPVDSERTDGSVAGWSRAVDFEHPKLALLETLDLPGKRLLDVGAGSGAFVAAATEAGYEAEGQDIAAAVAQAAARDFGVVIHARPVSELDGGYDVVTLWDTLEHCAEPGVVVRDCARLLVPGGHLVVLSPHGHGISARLFGSRWWVFGPQDHLVMFSVSALRGALEGAGLRVVDWHTRQLSPPYPPESAHPRRVGMRLFNRLEPNLRLRSRLIHWNLGDWVFAAGRKPGRVHA